MQFGFCHPLRFFENVMACTGLPVPPPDFMDTSIHGDRGMQRKSVNVGIGPAEKWFGEIRQC